MGFQEAYARRSNSQGITQQTALGQLFEGTKWQYFSWEGENVFNMNPIIVDTDRFLPIASGATTIDFEEFLGSEVWQEYVDLHTFFHGDESGNVHFLGPERYVNWVVADDLVGGGTVAFLTSHYETFIGQNHRGPEEEELFEYFTDLVNSSFGYASEQIHAQAEALKGEFGNLGVVIGGDFETADPELPAQKAFADAGYIETWRFINGDARRPTQGIDNMFVRPDSVTVNDSYYDQAPYSNGASDHKPLYSELTLTSGRDCVGTESIRRVMCRVQRGTVKKAIVRVKNATPGQKYKAVLDTGEKATKKAKDNGKIWFRFKGGKAPECGPNGVTVCGQRQAFDCDC